MTNPQRCAGVVFLFSFFFASTVLAGDVLKATFDTGTTGRGIGHNPPATSGPPSPLDGIEVGSGSFYPADSASYLNSAYWIDPAAGLNGSAKGLHVVRYTATEQPLTVTLAASPTQNPSTATTPYWIDYRFKTDPANSTLVGGQFYIFSSQASCPSCDPLLWESTIGEYSLNPSGPPTLMYAIVQPGPYPLALLGDVTASTEWRVVMKIDPGSDEQTHWVYRNGVLLDDPILGKPYHLASYLANAFQGSDVANIQFQAVYNGTAAGSDLDSIIDEVRISTDGPAFLKAYPAAVGQINLTWTDNSSSESGYRVQRSSDGQSWSQIGSDLAANATSHNDTTATAKQRYYYRVGALGPGGAAVWSNTAYAFAVYTGGPLSDWLDVTAIGTSACQPCTDDDELCPAVPGDAIDDTCALQQALNVVNYSTHPDDPHVLYFPNGTYKIKQTLFLEGQTGAEIIGQSPGNVIINWDWTALGGGEGTKDPCTGIVAPKVMFHAKNNFHLVVSNLVFDGGKAAAQHETYVVGFDLSACRNTDTACGALGNTWYQLDENKGVVDSGTAIFDSTFRNAWVGMRIGHYNFQDSELSVRRSQFLNNEFGTSVEDPNALQLHFWDCKWDNNRARAITNLIYNFGGEPNSWAGDFTVERGRFTNNGQDVYYSPTGQFRVRDSWSRGSGMFIFGYGIDSSPANFTISNNYVDDISPSKILDDYSSMATPPLCSCQGPDQENCCQSPNPARCFLGVDLSRGRAIANLNSGGIVLLDNKFDLRNASDPWMTNPANATQVANTAEPVLSTTANTSAIVALSNLYAAAQGYEQTGVSLKLTSIGDLTSQPELGSSIPALPVPNDILANHKVFTVSDGSTAQSVIDAAVAAAQTGPIVIHFPTNQYVLTSTLNVPAVPNDLVITGSGASTTLIWRGAGTGPMLKLGGYHAKTTVRDLTLRATDGSSRADGVVVDDVNDATTRVFMNRLATYAPKTIDPLNVPVTGGVEIDRADLTMVDVFDFQASGFVSKCPITGCLPGNYYDDFLFKVTAGPQPQTTKSIWSSSAGGAKVNFVGVNGPQGLKWLIAGSYMEGGPFYLDVSGGGGNGNVAVIGGRIAAEHTTDTEVVNINNFKGNVSVVNTNIMDIDPTTGGGPVSTLPTTGTIIKQTGSNPVDIESVGNSILTDPGKALFGAATLTRAGDKLHVCNPDRTYTINSTPQQAVTLAQCWKFEENPPGSGQYAIVPLQPGEQTGETTADMPDTFTTPTSQDIQRLNAGFDLYRNTTIPGYYDEPGAQATYQINFDNVKISDPITGVRINGGIPAAPAMVSGSALSALQVNVSWTDSSSNEDGFKVRRATSASGPFSLLSPNPGPGVTSFADTTTAEATSYWYSVASYRNSTGESGATLSPAVPTPPKAPTGLGALPSGTNAVGLTWTDNSTAESGFTVQRSSTSSTCPLPNVGSAPAKTGTGTVTFTDTNAVVDGTRYWYCVTATKPPTFPDSPPAGPATATTQIKTPTNLAATSPSTQHNVLTWNDNSASEQGYLVERAPKVGGGCGAFGPPIGSTGPGSGTPSTQTYHDIGTPGTAPLPNTWYCYRVRAYNTTGNSPISNQVMIKTHN